MFWISLIFFAVTVVAILVAMARPRDRGNAALTAVVAGIVGVGLLILSCASVVDARKIGVVVAFKRPTGAVTGAGLQWTKPWEDVEDWDATAQVYDHGDEKKCVSVRIAGGGQGCVELTVGWRAAVPRGPENFAAFRKTGDLSGFEVFTDRRVNKPITAEVQSLFTTFNPFEGVEGKVDDGGLPPSPDLNALYRQKLTDRVNLAVGGGQLAADGKTVQVDRDNPATKNVFEDDPDGDVVITSVTFGFIRYDDQTNARLADYGNTLLENRKLRVDKANAALRKQIATDSGMTPFQRECLDKGGAYAAFCGGGNATLSVPAK